MEQKFVKYLYSSFAQLVERYGFVKQGEINEGKSYSIEYCSDIFTIKLEKYSREFYVTLYKTGSPDNGVNLFNLLDYLKSSNFSNFKYFDGELQGEIQLGEYYKKQFNHLATTVQDNMVMINNFFNSENLESKLSDITKFMLDKYPALFKR
jgi:hypothetical protein